MATDFSEPSNAPIHVAHGYAKAFGARLGQAVYGSQFVPAA